METTMDDTLPSELTVGAILQGGEYGWSIAAFPDAQATSIRLGYACLGGQFQFRLDDATCEMYWLNADSSARTSEESWSEYARRSCEEVSQGFQRLAASTDFRKAALDWPTVQGLHAPGIDPAEFVVFVAYFITEQEWQNLQSGNGG
jgi:hypothetical protein